MTHDPLWAHDGQLLTTHLAGVGLTAGKFARAFRAEEYGKIAGCLHDLGKAELEFQKRVTSNDKEGKKEPHAHHGAAHALAADLWPVAIAINGHHGRLAQPWRCRQNPGRIREEGAAVD